MNRKLRKFLFFIGFQPDGQPKNWVRFLLLRDQKTGKPRKYAGRMIFMKNGCIRPVLADWYEGYLGAASSEKLNSYRTFIQEQILRGHLASARSLHIVPPQITDILAESLVECLSKTRLIVTRGTEMPESFSHDLYLVVIPQFFDRMPPPDRTLVMQMEQVKSSLWATPEYLDLINRSLAILDYSRDNIDSLVRRGIPNQQLFYVPLIPFRVEVEDTNDRDIDILFYGGTASPRRRLYLEALSVKFKIRVETSLFGEELHKILRRTKIVVNIHFYEAALLETTRILECVRFGAKVVSETARDQADYDSLSPLVAFVTCGDIPAFLDAVEMHLNSWRSNAPALVSNDLGGMKYHLLRAFNAIGILDFNELMSELESYSLPSGQLALVLPEASDLYESARQALLPETKMFHGLRHVDEWQGCALSYKLIALLALRAELDRVLIYKGHVAAASDLSDRIEIVEEYLSDIEGRWDVFFGLITDVKLETKVYEVKERGGEIFVHTDAFGEMSFCIFGRAMLEWMSAYDSIGEDGLKYTMSRYLEVKNPRSVTVLDPLVGRAQVSKHPAWNCNDIQSSSMISESKGRLEELVRQRKLG